MTNAEKLALNPALFTLSEDGSFVLVSPGGVPLATLEVRPSGAIRMRVLEARGASVHECREVALAWLKNTWLP